MDGFFTRKIHVKKSMTYLRPILPSEAENILNFIKIILKNKIITLARTIYELITYLKFYIFIGLDIWH